MIIFPMCYTQFWNGNCFRGNDRYDFRKLDNTIINILEERYVLRYAHSANPGVWVSNAKTPAVREVWLDDILLEKVADCFPVAYPQTEEDAQLIYQMDEKYGVMLPKRLLSNFNAKFILQCYAVLNLISPNGENNK